MAVLRVDKDSIHAEVVSYKYENKLNQMRDKLRKQGEN